MINSRDTAWLIAGLCDLPTEHPDIATMQAIFEEASRFADAVLDANGKVADRVGCRLENGRVFLPPCQRESWENFIQGGWNALSAPESYGGQGLPLTVASAVQMLFDSSDVAFGMLALNQRCAIRLLLKVASPELQAVWIPRFMSGEWAATICISEPDAGSDVGRIRTRAELGDDGRFRITGQKCWISYGDHDLTKGIAHFILARSPGMAAGTRGLSLFLVTDQCEDGTRNGVTVLRIEEKLGLHASPTCVMEFDGALATPLGAPGRGLAVLFEMIVVMRLGVAAQGCAIAGRAAAIAARYAFERRQGGAAEAPAIAIHNHAEVRRALLEMAVTATALTAMTLQTAIWLDGADNGDIAAGARAAIMLPVIKALAAEAAFANANQAIQVLGGAGYTKEWPVERLLRDSRVFSIYEGTTAIQALDLTFRKILGPGKDAAADVLDRFAPSAKLRALLDGLIRQVSGLNHFEQEHAALPLLRLFGLVCADGILRRFAAGDQQLAGRFSALLTIHECHAEAEANRLVAQAQPHDLSKSFEALFPGG